MKCYYVLMATHENRYDPRSSFSAVACVQTHIKLNTGTKYMYPIEKSFIGRCAMPKTLIITHLMSK